MATARGRHWLDLARYADTKGYVFQEERRYPFSYTYRDYVIRSLNEDKPYDEFVREQIAGDLMGASSSAEYNDHITATAFLAWALSGVFVGDRPVGSGSDPATYGFVLEPLLVALDRQVFRHPFKGLMFNPQQTPGRVALYVNHRCLQQTP